MELFNITFNNYTYRYNNSTENITDSGGYIYRASSIIRKDLTTDIEKAECNIVASSEEKPFNIMLSQTSIVPIPIVIKIYPEETVLFEGIVTGIKYDIEKGFVDINLSSKISLDEITLPKVTYSPYCSWELFSKECGKNKINYEVNITTNSSVYNNIIVTNTIFSSYPKGYFTNGYIILDTGEAMLITDSSEDTLTLLAPINTFKTSKNIKVYPGCAKTIETCINKYNNLTNFSGFPFIPDNNPVTQEY